MRIKLMNSEANTINSGVAPTDITFSGPVVLHADPTVVSGAATKQYVDNRNGGLDASGITTGVIGVNTLPVFGGAASNEQGSNVFTLADTPVVPGVYPKVSVDNTGRIVGGEALTLGDIPDLPWNKVTRDKPTLMAGYGIADGVSLVGGEVEAGFGISAVPTEPNHIVNLVYLNSALAEVGAQSEPGTLITSYDSLTPFGHLRTNGAKVSKTTYADLYSEIGNRFEEHSYPGAGKPWKQQYEFNGEGDALGTWTTAPSLPGVLERSQAVVTKNRVYLLGGYNGSSSLATVYTAPINSDGTLGVWTTAPSLPGPLHNSQAIVTKSRVYLLGGVNASAIAATVYTAPINSDGTLGTWTTGPSLPAALYRSQAVVTKNRVYLLGGGNGSATVATVYTAPINSDGTLGSWTTAPSLPAPFYYSQAVVTKNRVYLLGGYNGSAVAATVYTAPINSDGTLGTWTTAPSLPGVLHGSQAIITKNRVYLLGGAVGTTGTVATVYTAPINSDGTLGAWTTAPSLPAGLGNTQAIVIKNKVYLLGGYNDTTYISTVYTATLSGGLNDYSPYYDGSALDALEEVGHAGAGQPWSQQYEFNIQGNEIGAWSAGTSVPEGLFAAQVVVTKNRVYLIGGITDNLNYSKVSGRVYTAPINPDGTLGTWLQGASLPGPISRSQAIVTKNRVYLLGGHNGSTTVATVYTAPINSDGTLGTWVNAPQFAGGTRQSQVVVTKSRVYLLGGHNDSGAISSTTSASINADGTLGAWVPGPPLPVAIYDGQAIVTKNRVYLTSGTSGTAVYTAPINVDGTLGTWSTDSPLPASSRYGKAVVTKNRVYILGASTSGGPRTLTAPINQDGTLGTWGFGSSLPGELIETQAIVTSSRIYLLSGWTGDTTKSSVVRTVYTATLSGGLNDYSPYYEKYFTGNLSEYVYPGSGKPWKQQYEFNNEGDVIGTWSAGTNLPDVLGYSQAIVTKNRVYLMSGYNGSAYLATVYTAPINSDGTLGTWTTAPSLPGALGISQAIVTKNRVYLLGGYNGSATVATVYTAPINADGTLGTWTTAPSLPGSLHGSQAIITKNRVYLLGGYTGASGTAAVYTAPINTDGTLGAWTTGTSLPGVLWYSQAIVTKNRVYLLGGYNGSATVATVYTAPINADGTLGTWTVAPSLPVGLYIPQAIVTKNRVYLLGGHSGTTVATVYTAPINADGTLGAWVTAPSLPLALHGSQAIITKNRVYLLGGYTDASGRAAVYTATLSGGLNDYEPYYDGTFSTENTITTFALPNLTPDDKNLHTYIKY